MQLKEEEQEIERLQTQIKTNTMFIKSTKVLNEILSKQRLSPNRFNIG